MSEFLENLKKAADTGNFNSEAAKKINEIDDKANNFSETRSVEQMEDSLTEKALDAGIKTVSEKDITKLNSEYEEKMKERAKEERLLATIVELVNLDVELKEKLYELGIYIRNLREKYMDDETNTTLFEKLDQLEEKYDFSKYIDGE